LFTLKGGVDLGDFFLCDAFYGLIPHIILFLCDAFYGLIPHIILFIHYF